MSQSDYTEWSHGSNELHLKYLTRACRVIYSFSTKWPWIMKCSESRTICRSSWLSKKIQCSTMQRKSLNSSWGLIKCSKKSLSSMTLVFSNEFIWAPCAKSPKKHLIFDRFTQYRSICILWMLSNFDRVLYTMLPSHCFFHYPGIIVQSNRFWLSRVQFLFSVPLLHPFIWNL